jgi:hypothetical protein
MSGVRQVERVLAKVVHPRNRISGDVDRPLGRQAKPPPAAIALQIPSRVTRPDARPWPGTNELALAADVHLDARPDCSSSEHFCQLP